jgi:hypothetical protein
MEVFLGTIMSSLLVTVQKIGVVKTFPLPSIDFLLLNEEIGKMDIHKQWLSKPESKLTNLFARCADDPEIVS